MEYQITLASENALIVYFGEQKGASTSLVIAEQIRQVKRTLQREVGQNLIDLVPSYASLLVVFDPFKVDYFAVKKLIKDTINATKREAEELSKVIELPVYYGDDVGLDLIRIADKAGITTEEVINIHQRSEYRVFAIGFAPGFGYLGEVDERISMPRLATPRAAVPKGAVGIADRQTAIYPAQSPGGWNIIGRCPIAMFSPTANQTMPFDIGDRVKFKAINKAEFLALGGEL